MNITPVSEFEIVIRPETPVELFFINQFLVHWHNGAAKLKIESSIAKLELTAPPAVISLKNP